MSDSEEILPAEKKKKELQLLLDERSRRQGAVRSCITRIEGTLAEEDASLIKKLEEQLTRFRVSWERFEETHGQVVTAMDFLERDVTTVLEKRTDLRREYDDCMASADSWLHEAHNALDNTVLDSSTLSKSIGLHETTMLEQSSVAEEDVTILQRRLYDRDDEVKRMDQQMSALAARVRTLTADNSEMTAIRSNFEYQSQQYEDRDRRQASRISELEETVRRHRDDVERERQKHLVSSTPVRRPDDSRGANATLGRDDLSTISYIVSQSNAEMFKEVLDHSHVKQKQLLSTLNVPRVELTKFNGDLTSYYSFSNRFEELIGNSDATPAVKLSNLLQNCEPEIAELLDCCNHKGSAEGYKLAKTMLRETYGDPFLVSQAWIDKLMDFPLADTPALMRRYAAALRSARETLLSLGYISELECTKSMRQIIDKTPIYVQNKWRATHRECGEKGKRASLQDMIRIIANAAKELNDPIYGKESMAKLRDQASSKTVKKTLGPQATHPVQFRKKAASAATILATSDEVEQDENEFVNKFDSSIPSPSPPKELCVICKRMDVRQHLTSRCFVYRDYGAQERLDFVRAQGLCFLCLCSGHAVSACPCPSHWRCCMPGCEQKHHFTLHRALSNTPSAIPARAPRVLCVEAEDFDTKEMIDEVELNSCGLDTDTDVKIKVVSKSRGHFLLPVLPVCVLDNKNCGVDIHVLQDTGSSLTMISQVLFDRLGLKPVGRADLKIRGVIAGQKLKTPIMELGLVGRDVGTLEDASGVIVIDEIALSPMHVQALRKASQHPHLASLSIRPYDHDQVDMIIGQDNSHLLEPLCKISCKTKYAPHALRTRLGWTIHGGKTDQIDFWDAWEEVSSLSIAPSPSLEAILQSMWDVDRVPEVVAMSPVDREILKMWDKTAVVRDGHWELPIPFIQNPPNLPNNYSQAKSNLDRIGRRLQRDDRLKEQYIAAMVKNFTSGYAEIAPEIPRSGYEWYNTHLSVITDRRPGKCRIVKNSSLRYGNTSLNESVHQGPNLTNGLVGISIRFRVFEVAVTGDIKEMYNQVRVPAEQRDSLRFLWWADNQPGGEIVKCRMRTHQFGGKWSPCATMYSMKKTSEIHRGQFDDDVCDTLLKDFYVDDWLKSVLSVPVGLRLISGLRSLLDKVGFELTKFGSNKVEIMQAIEPAHRAKAYECIELDVETGVVDKTLGSLWRPLEDVFGYKIVLRPQPMTRRGLLSTYSSVYDPMGYVGPVVLQAKIIVQAVCKQADDWDKPIPEEYRQQWSDWLERLPELSGYTIPRWLGVTLEPGHSYQLHVFVDASEIGYGVNVYLAILSGDDVVIRASLVTSKAKVNPLKQVTIPRLELCAAVMGAKLERIVSENMEFSRLDSIFWSDSMIVLSYINSQSRQFKTFVANRVAVIQELTEERQWKFVPGKLNIADMTSRGASVQELSDCVEWQRGPGFLYDRERWPIQPSLTSVHDIPGAELKRGEIDVQTAQVHCYKQVHCLQPLWEYYSDWAKLVKAVCYWIKGLSFLRSGGKFLDVISPADFLQGTLVVLSALQTSFIPPDQRRNSSFQKLFPQFSDGLFRVGGRLGYSTLGEEEKHPIILPKCEPVKAMIRQIHLRLAHSGVDRTFYELRKKYWLLGGKALIRSVIRACVDCHKFRGRPETQQMAPLPEARVTAGTTPFETVGIDLFGPLMVKVGRSDCKRWACLVSCFASRATHIEIVPDLSTAAFIDALSRFISRRGRPKKIVTDNGTNFVGAVRELSEMVDSWNRRQIKAFLRDEMIEWRFNTPTASHHGGVWERQNRTARELMMRLLRNRPLSEFSLITLICKIEAMMNGRPLSRLTEDPDDMLPITPNHLLHVSKVPHLSGDHTQSDALRSKWKNIEALSDEFWRLWSGSYLKDLQARQKWLDTKPNVKVGELVLEVKESLYQMRWPLAVVTEVFPGRDGLVRSVKIRTADGVYQRPISKIVRLELDQ